MSVPEANLDIEGKNLSLIDFCSEDDCLYASPPRDHSSLRISDDQKEQKNIQVQTLEGSIEGDEQVIQPFELSDEKKTKKNEKYNLRKSLAWDNAFFTSAGVLEPEELSTMIWGVKQGENRSALPGIEEEICRSSESICTLATDKSTLGTIEDDLFGDIRASIQKSSKACTEIRKAQRSEEKLALTGIEEDMRMSNDSISTFATENSTLGTVEDDLFGDVRASIQKSSKASRATSQSKLASGVNASQLIKSSEKVGTVSQNKLMTKAALKKPSIVIKGSGKMVNKVFSSPDASKCGSRTGESASSLSKPPKILARASSLSAAPTKRASLSANSIKAEKGNAKTLNEPRRGSKVPANGASRYGVPKPLQPVKSSLRSSVAAKTHLTPSSSIDSFESQSSNSSSKHSSEIEKQKVDSKTGNYSSVSSTARSTTRTAPRNSSQTMNSRISPHLKSLTKPSSSTSPASSVSEWSSESLSPTSTLNSRSNISRPSIDTSSCKNASNKADAFQASYSGNHSNDNCSGGNRVNGLLTKSAKRVSIGSGALNRPEVIKPSGLRMPSPKIGFFDGARSMVRTPTGNLKSPTAPSNLPRSGLGNVSPGNGLKEARREKIQPARTVTAIRGTKAGAQKPALETKPKSPLPLQESSNLSPKVPSGSRAGKNCPGVPLKTQFKKSPGKDEQCNLNLVNIAKEFNTAVCNTDVCDSERSNSRCKDKVSACGKGNDSGKVVDIPSVDGGSSAACNSSSTIEQEGEFCHQKNDLKRATEFQPRSPLPHNDMKPATEIQPRSLLPHNDSKPAIEIQPRSPLPQNDLKPATEIQARSPLPQKASNLSPKVFSGSKTGKRSPAMPLEVQNKKSLEKVEQCNLNTENIATKESNVGITRDLCDSERSNSLCKEKLSSNGEGTNSEKFQDIPTADGGSTATCNSSCTVLEQGEFCGQKNDLKPASEFQPRSPSLHKASNLSPEVFNGSKTGKRSPRMPLEVQNKKSPEKVDQCNLNAENIATKESNTAMSNPGVFGSERRGSIATCNSSYTMVEQSDSCIQKNDLKPASEIQHKSPSSLQQASNLSPGVFSVSKTGKHSPGMPLKVQNKKSPEKVEQCILNVENIAAKESNSAMSNPDFCSSERNGSLCKDNRSSNGEGKVEEIPTLRGSSATCNSSSTTVEEGSQKNDLNSFSNGSKKENTSVHDEVDELARQFGAFGINEEIQQKPADDGSLYRVNISIELNSGVQVENVNLSMPAASHIHIQGVKVADTDES